MYISRYHSSLLYFVFFFTDTATTETYTSLHSLSLHDALPIGADQRRVENAVEKMSLASLGDGVANDTDEVDRLHCRTRQLRRADEMLHRSEEHTSELQSLMRISYAVFCLKKKQKKI